MKKILAISVVLLLLLPMLVTAQNLGSQGLGKPKITAIGALGRGIAIPEDNPREFSIIKVGIAKLRVLLVSEEKDIAAGLVWFDNTRYLLKNVAIAEGHITADVYLNTTKVGTIDISLTEKGNVDIWVGQITINNKDYNIYILEGQRKFKNTEIAENVMETCSEDLEECKDIAKGIGNRFCNKLDDKSCREKIQEFCKQNPDDRRCLVIARLYCKDNIDDTRCRHLLREYCSNNQDTAICGKICNKFPRFCSTTGTTPETGECGWCGNRCVRKRSNMKCLDVMPPEGFECVESNGRCVTRRLRECKTLYWFDDTTRTCDEPKEFCGTYMYSGLRTFETKEECLAALQTTATTTEVQTTTETTVVTTTTTESATTETAITPTTTI